MLVPVQTCCLLHWKRGRQHRGVELTGKDKQGCAHPEAPQQCQDHLSETLDSLTYVPTRLLLWLDLSFRFASSLPVAEDAFKDCEIIESGFHCLNNLLFLTARQHFLAVTDDVGLVRILEIPKTLYVRSRQEVRHTEHRFITAET